MLSRNKVRVLSILVMAVLAGAFDSNAEAACTGSSPTWTCTAGSTAAQINSCIQYAKPGDTINIGEGSGSWTTTIVIDRGIHLIGAGSSNTTITHEAAGDLIRILPDDTSLNPEFEITGFTFKSGNKVVIRLGEENYQPQTFQNQVNIHENVVTGATTSNSNNQYIWIHNMGGVVWKNTFTGKDQQIRSIGHGGDGDIIWGLVPDTRGTANALYIEDNVFNWTGESNSYLADCQYASTGRVWRYNTINIGQEIDSVVDFHGYNTGNYHSCYGDELYGNKIVMTNNNDFQGYAGVRGSTAMIFDNSAQTSGSASNGNHNGEYGCPSRVSERIRWYNWTNTKNLNTLVTSDPERWGSAITCDGTSSYSALNRNVFNYTTSFKGSGGMGCGSSLPTPTGYSERVGFWVTNQSCSNVSGLVGDVVNNPSRGIITGELYAIQSGSWVKIYTPYTYPHPLRGKSDVLQAPAGLKVIERSN